MFLIILKILEKSLAALKPEALIWVDHNERIKTYVNTGDWVDHTTYAQIVDGVVRLKSFKIVLDEDE